MCAILYNVGTIKLPFIVTKNLGSVCILSGIFLLDRILSMNQGMNKF